jgi:hypothetical protein
MARHFRRNGIVVGCLVGLGVVAGGTIALKDSGVGEGTAIARQAKPINSKDGMPLSIVGDIYMFTNIFRGGYASKSKTAFDYFRPIKADIGYYSLESGGAYCTRNGDRQKATEMPFCKLLAPDEQSDGPCFEIKLIGVALDNYKNSNPKGDCNGYPTARDGYHFMPITANQLPSYLDDPSGKAIKKRIQLPAAYKNAKLMKVTVFKDKSPRGEFYFVFAVDRWYFLAQNLCDKCGA